MANVYQQAVKKRKIAYLAAIGVLFLCSLLVRGTFFRIDKKSADEVRSSGALALTLDGRAKVHELTELQQGETELGGAAIQLMLTGSRGFAVCALWLNANEKQRRQEWNELDIAVDSITKLQPHFTAPWLFQSWNLTYNVSVEMDRLNDMYFYIARGISVLAKGEHLNRSNPDLRWNTAFYYQNKFGVSDRVTTLRCLYQLSCIPEEERNPELFKSPDGSLNIVAFDQFCKDHPQLVRRLKEVRVPIDGNEDRARPLADSPEAVVAFLRNNRKVPTRFKQGSKELNDRMLQFPVFPELTNQPVTTQEQDYRSPLADHESDAFLAARAWYSLANCSLPPPSAIPTGDGKYNPDPLKYKIPKRPSTIIFRHGPPRAQTYAAERLMKEGWFDREPWAIDDPTDRSAAWLKQVSPDGQVTVLGSKYTTPVSAQEAWTEASRRWRDHGRANGLLLDPALLAEHLRRAEEFCKRRPGLMIGSPNVPPLTFEEEQNPAIVAERNSHIYITNWSINRSMTNFEGFDIESDALREADAIGAKKKFYQADQAARSADYRRAQELYREGFDAWKRVLASKQDCRNRRATDPSSLTSSCRDFRDVERYQEDMYELSLKYTKVLQTLNQRALQESTPIVFDVLQMANAGLARSPAIAATANMVLVAEVEQLPPKKGETAIPEPRFPQLRDLPALRLPGPLDGTSEDGSPWVNDMVKQRVMQKLGLLVRNQAPPTNTSGNDAPKTPSATTPAELSPPKQ